MSKKDTTPKEARAESELFEELQKLCFSPGYIHAIAYFCWRDNLVRFLAIRLRRTMSSINTPMNSCSDLKFQHS